MYGDEGSMASTNARNAFNYTNPPSFNFDIELNSLPLLQ